MSKIKDAKKANFELKKFKFTEKNTIAEYLYLHEEKNEKRNYIVKTPAKAHPDLWSLFNQLREYVCREFYIEPTPENLLQVDVNSISVENRLCVISVTFDTLHGKKVSVSTSKINLDDNETGLEEEIDAIIDAVNDEVFQYLFKDKRADPELFSEENAEDSEPKEEVKSGLNISTMKKVS